MRDKFAVRIIQYGISFLVGLLISFSVAFYRGFAFSQAMYLNARYFSDGFFVAGLFLAGIGALMAISNTGLFDMISYGFSSLIVLFTPFRNPRKHASFYDYKTEKDARRGKSRFTLLIVGLGFCMFSLICLALYYHLSV